MFKITLFYNILDLPLSLSDVFFARQRPVSALNEFKFTDRDSEGEDLSNGHYSSHERKLLDFFYTSKGT